MTKDLRRFLFLKLKLVTVSQFIVSHCYLNKEFAVIFHRYLNKEFVVHTVLLDWKHTFIALIYGFMYGKSKLIEEFCFSIKPLLWPTKKAICIIEKVTVYTIWQISPKGGFTKKMFLKSKNIFLH